MLEWMQTHRKWLVITIWIATIAFIGAGFVGWGQFQFSKSSSEVAKVGNTPVTMKDWQYAYQRLYNQINNQLGGKLDQALAKKLGLQKQALQMAITQALLMQYAKDLDLKVTDEDVARKILEVFGSKKQYFTYLRNTGQKAEEFENRLRKQLLVEKLLDYLHLKPQKPEILAVASSLYNADNMEIAKINKSDINITINEDEVKKYWEKHKNDYMSPEMYKIAYVKIPLKGKVTEKELKTYYENHKLEYKDSNGVIMSYEKAKNLVKKDYLAHKLKREAVIAYKNLKNSKGNFKIAVVPLKNNILPKNIMQKLIANGSIKPVIYKNSYVIATLLEQIKPKPLTYQQAKPLVLKDFINYESIKGLIKLAKEKLKNFKGKETGFITKFDIMKLKLFKNVNYTEQFLMSVFTSQKPKGFVLIPIENPKYAVLYKITAQKLLEKKEYEKNKKYVYQLTDALINNMLYRDLIQYLTQKYKIEVYVKD
jgi:peptidyl-prolyl cis-trans isomerase D